MDNANVDVYHEPSLEDWDHFKLDFPKLNHLKAIAFNQFLAFNPSITRAMFNIDNTIIYGRNEEMFLTLLDPILSKLAEFNVRRKPSKCYFGMGHIEFLGLVLANQACNWVTRECKGPDKFQTHFFEGSQKFCRHGQLLPRLNQWSLTASNP